MLQAVLYSVVLLNGMVLVNHVSVVIKKYVIFASFETVKKLCDEKMVPVYTSEAGLVKRGAKASFGADFYQWGFQAGEQAAAYLKNKKELPKPQPVKARIKTVGN